MDHARQWAWVLIQKYSFIFMLPASTNLHLHQDNERLAGYCSVKIPNVLRWKHSAVVRSDVRWWHIAEPKSPIFHLYGGGKPWSRGLVPPGRDVQTLSGKAHSGNYHPLYNKYTQREGLLNSLPIPAMGILYFTCHSQTGSVLGGSPHTAHWHSGGGRKGGTEGRKENITRCGLSSSAC